MKATELIKPEDLRFGNHMHFEIKGKKYVNGQITEIHKDCVFINSIKIPRYDMLKPIELTEELLLRVGAEDQDGYFQHDRFELRYRKEYKFWYVLDLESATYLTKVEYLHEYQNFYKAMNGKELTLN